MKHGVVAVIYDYSNDIYLLILHRDRKSDWRFLRTLIADGENPEAAIKREIKEKLGMANYKIVKVFPAVQKLAAGNDEIVNDVYLIEASMNTPVKLGEKVAAGTYLWANKASVQGKLLDEDKKLLELAAASMPS